MRVNTRLRSSPNARKPKDFTMKSLAERIGEIERVNIYGRVVGVRGLMVEIAGPIHAMSVGARIVIETGVGRAIPAEVVGFNGDNAVVMPFAGLDGVRCGCRALIADASGQVRPAASWLGRRYHRGRRRCRTVIRRRRRIRANGSANRSISASAP